MIIILERILILTILCATITVISIKSINVGIRRLYLIFYSVSIFIYSGIGTTYNNIQFQYLINFLIFYSVTSFSMVFYFKLSVNKKKQSSIRFFPTSILKIFVFTFLIVYIARLLIPTNNLIYLIIPPKLSIIDIFKRQEIQRSSLLLEGLRLLSIFSFPFFLIYLNRMKSNGKIFLTIFLLLLWIYLQYISLGYISRYELVLFSVFLILIFFNRKNNTIKIKWIHIFAIVIAFILVIPFLYAFEQFRLGSSDINTSFFDSIRLLFIKETDYSKYYNSSLSMYKKSNIIGYFYWLFTLPIPSVIAGSIKDNIFIINNYFTEWITGIGYGENNFSILLPSVLGESFILYGAYFYWIHGIFISIFLATLCVSLEKGKDYEILNLYFAVQTLAIGRGGSSGIIGFAINSLLIFFVVITLFSLMIKKGVFTYAKKNTSVVNT